MTYVIAGSCIKDDSCIEVCPVDCIHPKPGAHDFETAEQLYIDPDVCIDCDACVEACPVDAIWADALECYLAELYVVPQRRGRGLGRALMEAAIETARAERATHMDLGTGEDDMAARALYESLGFSNREGKPDGPLNFFYEREL